MLALVRLADPGLDRDAVRPRFLGPEEILVTDERDWPFGVDQDDVALRQHAYLGSLLHGFDRGDRPREIQVAPVTSVWPSAPSTTSATGSAVGYG